MHDDPAAEDPLPDADPLPGADPARPRELSNFGWIRPGALAAMGRPRADDWTEIVRRGIRAVLCLTERASCEDPERHGLEVLHVPVADFAAPSLGDLERAVAWIDRQQAAARPVLVHCGAGYGRTGTIVAAWLVSRGVGPEDAIEQVRSARPGSIETGDQVDAIHRFADRRGRRGRAAEPRTDEHHGRERGAEGRERMGERDASKVLRVVFVGAKGRMGRALCPGLEATEGIRLVARIDREDDVLRTLRDTQADVAVDFTEPSSAVANARAIVRGGAQGVIGTTGFTERDLDALDAEARAAGRGLLIAPNFAVGVLLMQRFAEEAARHFDRVEIVETHHEGKKDAPSGTALRTAERLARLGVRPGPGGEVARGLDVGGVNVHSLRLPGIMARQEVHFGSAGEALVIRHDALSRECYLPGVVAAIRGVPGKVGVLRGLESILFAGA